MVVIEAEMDCKRTGAPQELLCHRALLNLCQLRAQRPAAATASPVDDRALSAGAAGAAAVGAVAQPVQDVVELVERAVVQDQRAAACP